MDKKTDRLKLAVDELGEELERHAAVVSFFLSLGPDQKVAGLGDPRRVDTELAVWSASMDWI